MTSQSTSMAQLTTISTGRSLSDSLNIVQTIKSSKKRRVILNSQNREKESPKLNHHVQENTDRVPVPETETDRTINASKAKAIRKDGKRLQTKKYLNEMMPFIYNRSRGTNELETLYDNHEENNVQDEKEIKKDQSDESRKILNEETYMEQLIKLKEENEGIKKRKQSIISRYANLVYSYEYGLNSVRKLNDLRFAPDNILKGNDYVTDFEDNFDSS